ncbi:MAG: hypothetical protein KDD41_03920 [Flavobacteriales bacterium]|nr:hypothetical protein [Flavobacteriales bacterium]
MIKAGALLYAMFLVVVIAIITSSFILVDYFNNAYITRAIKEETAYRNLHSGMNYGQVNYQHLPINTKHKLDLFDDGSEVILYKQSWGAFYRLTASTDGNKGEISKSALLGSDYRHEEQVAIYLLDQNKPLSLTGKTDIKGICYLPKKGVERAYIEGKSFSGATLINGTKKTSANKLPEINTELIRENEQWLHQAPSLADSIMDYELFLETDTVRNGFGNRTLTLYSPHTIVVENKTIRGNIILKSERNIIIRNTARMEDVLCYARGIQVEEDCVLNGQFFATDSIVTENNCRFVYPSVIALLNSGKNDQKKITLGEKNVLKGSVFLNCNQYDHKNRAALSIGEGSEIMGQVYSSDQLELRGNVSGGLTCRSFLLRTPSSVYENHLMDVTIDRSALPDDFVGVALTETTTNYRIIKWLD